MTKISCRMTIVVAMVGLVVACVDHVGDELFIASQSETGRSGRVLIAPTDEGRRHALKGVMFSARLGGSARDESGVFAKCTRDGLAINSRDALIEQFPISGEFNVDYTIDNQSVTLRIGEFPAVTCRMPAKGCLRFPVLFEASTEDLGRVDDDMIWPVVFRVCPPASAAGS